VTDREPRAFARPAEFDGTAGSSHEVAGQRVERDFELLPTSGEVRPRKVEVEAESGQEVAEDGLGGLVVEGGEELDRALDERVRVDLDGRGQLGDPTEGSAKRPGGAAIELALLGSPGLVHEEPRLDGRDLHPAILVLQVDRPGEGQTRVETKIDASSRRNST
jgi:hypothetical protein